MAQTYAGDISAKDAWDVLKAETDAVLVDVRTDAEWAYVANADASKSSNSPFDGWRLRGRAVMTLVGGRNISHSVAVSA